MTEAEKKANHIESEKKRRYNIKLGLDHLISIVPALSESSTSVSSSSSTAAAAAKYARSEASVLQKSNGGEGYYFGCDLLN